MRNFIFAALLIVVNTLTIAAQRDIANSKEITITGRVLDADTQGPLEYATIVFKDFKTKEITTGGITSTDGNFSIVVPSGLYDISIEYISFKTKNILRQDLKKDTNIGVHTLELDFAALGEVEIIAERTTLELKLDKKIYNVGKDLTVSGGTVSDVLDNVPSVSVDVEGNVALRGNTNVRILINGKPSGLVGLNSTDALRQLPAESIERVEVITSPSARYDAEGTGGILNIILRRSKLQGLNGAITLNAGEPKNNGISANLNYRTGDFNFFNTSSFNSRNRPGNSLTENSYTNGTFFREKREFDRESDGFSTNTGVEWYVTDKASITASLVYRNSDENNLTTNNITEFDNAGNIINESLRLDPENEDDKTLQYSLNYDKQFGDDSQHRLTFDFQYETSKENENSLISEDGNAAERVNTLEEQDRVLLQADYTLPIDENSTFEFGYRGNFSTLDTDYTLEFFDGSNFLLDTDVSNNLVYREYVNAVYTQYGNKIGENFSYLFGLRMEDTRITIDQKTSGEFDRKTYTDFFPTVNLAYKFSDDESVTLGYNRRLSRPRSRFINPFPSRSSATNIFQGNSDIDPSYSNVFDIGYINSFGKLMLNTSLYFQRETSSFTFISEDTGETTLVGGTAVPIIRRFPINLATDERTGFEFTLTYRQSSDWNVNTSLNLFNSKTRGDFNGTNFDADNFSWFARLNNKLTLPGQIDWQTQLSYNGPREDAQNKSEGIFSTNMAFSKDLFNNNASIAFNVSDLFNSRIRKQTTTTDTFTGYSEFQWQERAFTLSFTYRFNQQKKNNRSRENNRGDDDIDFEG